MRRLILLIFAIAFFSSLFAQRAEYKAFKVDVGGLYAIPSGDGVKAGAGFYFEPKYNITDNIAAGLRMEWAMMGASDDLGDDVSISSLGSYLLTGDYYFNTKKVRPFAGLGVGLYSLGSIEFDDEVGEGEIDMGNKFGFAPRIGLLLGHFRLGLEYNVITGVDSDVFDSKNYLSFKFGFEIGGGKK